MKFATFCSGIGAPEVAWERLGWEPAFCCENAAFPSAVLKHHWPQTPNLGDMNKAHEKIGHIAPGAIDVVCAGTPCQSFSLAGLRAGMADPRGNLALQYIRLLDMLRPRWFVWENVPGVLSSWSDAEVGEDGTVWEKNDFDTLLAGFEEIGYSLAWRVLDAQFFGVPQRRQRVFVVGHLGGWSGPAAVLFDSKSLLGGLVQGKKARKVSATGPKRGTGSDSRTVSSAVTSKWRKSGGPSGSETHNLVAVDLIQVTNKLNASSPQVVAPTLSQTSRVVCFNYSAGAKARSASVTEDASPTIKSKGRVPAVFDMRNGTGSDVAQTLLAGRKGHGFGTNNVPHAVLPGAGIRRFTPRECERLQGFPDDHTLVPYGKNGALAKDSPRYEAIGNSMAVPVMEWIGRRIQEVDKVIQTKHR